MHAGRIRLDSGTFGGATGKGACLLFGPGIAASGADAILELPGK